MPGQVQVHLIMAPQEVAFPILPLPARNPEPCFILNVLERRRLKLVATISAELQRDVPWFRVFENSEFKEEVEQVSPLFHVGIVCSAEARLRRDRRGAERPLPGPPGQIQDPEGHQVR